MLDSTFPAIPTRAPPPCRLRDWRIWPLPNATLLGHATVGFNPGGVINSIPIFRRTDGSISAGSPSMPQLDKDGRHKLDGAGKKQYAALIVFEGGGHDLWNRTILQALADAGISPGAGEAAP